MRTPYSVAHFPCTDVRPAGFPPLSETLPEAIRRLVEGLRPEKIILFGSYAYGAPTADSDVDLLIIVETDLPRRERVVQASLLLYPRPFPVDILVKTPQEIDEGLRKGDWFLREILTRGTVLYERSNQSPGLG